MSYKLRSICDRRTFAALKATKFSARRGSVRSLFACSGEEIGPKIAFGVSKKVGNSVERNRIRRRIRAAIVSNLDQFAPGSYLIIPGKGALNASFEDLKLDVCESMRRSSMKALGLESTNG
ncbi:MAG: ribonuclease P protein component [Acidimicrobiales bacterium]|nr:ribonuclease P protein component [Acidimicrobiales bacterium]